MDVLSLKQELRTLTANTIRILAVEGVEKANSGHPGMPMGMADIAAVLWLKYLKSHPKHLQWFARDRFVLSNGHGSMLLYSLLHLSGYDVTIDDLKNFRQWESKTPGHPEFHLTPGVECTTGPLGQGISNAVGMALGQRLLAARYGADSPDVFSHRVFCFVGDGCLMEGISSEASSIAGHLGLGNLIVIYDDNHISIAGHTELAFTEDVLKRYEAYGWWTTRVDGHDFAAIDGALESALKVGDRPCLIAARTIIGKGSPKKADTHDVHGSPLGKEELAATKKSLGWTEEKEFTVPEPVKKLFAERYEELNREYAEWEQKFSSWSAKNPSLAERLLKQLRRDIPENLESRLIEALPKDNAPVSTRKLSQLVLQEASAAVDSLVGGSADLEPSTLTLIKGSTDVEKNAFGGLNLRFGVREHGMGAIMNGLSYYGAFIPYGSTFLCFVDYMKPTLRLAALSQIPGLFIYTHDSIFLGEDGPTHQPIEHLNSIRIIPNVALFRPADGLELAISYKLALERRSGPSVLVFTRQNLPVLERPAGFESGEISHGAYTVLTRGNAAKPDLVFIATGSEVSLACDAAKLLPDSLSVRVVSMPCWSLFAARPPEERHRLIPPEVNKVTLEAGSTFGWLGMIEGNSGNTLCLGIDHFGASAPQQVLAEKFGFTAEKVAERVKERFLSK